MDGSVYLQALARYKIHKEFLKTYYEMKIWIIQIFFYHMVIKKKCQFPLTWCVFWENCAQKSLWNVVVYKTSY